MTTENGTKIDTAGLIAALAVDAGEAAPPAPEPDRFFEIMGALAARARLHAERALAAAARVAEAPSRLAARSKKMLSEALEHVHGYVVGERSEPEPEAAPDRGLRGRISVDDDPVSAARTWAAFAALMASPENEATRGMTQDQRDKALARAFESFGGGMSPAGKRSFLGFVAGEGAAGWAAAHMRNMAASGRGAELIATLNALAAAGGVGDRLLRDGDERRGDGEKHEPEYVGNRLFRGDGDGLDAMIDAVRRSEPGVFEAAHRAAHEALVAGPARALAERETQRIRDDAERRDASEMSRKAIPLVAEFAAQAAKAGGLYEFRQSGGFDDFQRRFAAGELRAYGRRVGVDDQERDDILKFAEGAANGSLIVAGKPVDFEGALLDTFESARPLAALAKGGDVDAVRAGLQAEFLDALRGAGRDRGQFARDAAAQDAASAVAAMAEALGKRAAEADRKRASGSEQIALTGAAPAPDWSAVARRCGEFFSTRAKDADLQPPPEVREDLSRLFDAYVGDRPERLPLTGLRDGLRGIGLESAAGAVDRALDAPAMERADGAVLAALEAVEMARRAGAPEDAPAFDEAACRDGLFRVASGEQRVLPRDVHDAVVGAARDYLDCDHAVDDPAGTAASIAACRNGMLALGQHATAAALLDVEQRAQEILRRREVAERIVEAARGWLALDDTPSAGGPSPAGWGGPPELTADDVMPWGKYRGETIAAAAADVEYMAALERDLASITEGRAVPTVENMGDVLAAMQAAVITANRVPMDPDLDMQEAAARPRPEDARLSALEDGLIAVAHGHIDDLPPAARQVLLDAAATLSAYSDDARPHLAEVGAALEGLGQRDAADSMRALAEIEEQAARIAAAHEKIERAQSAMRAIAVAVQMTPKIDTVGDFLRSRAEGVVATTPDDVRREMDALALIRSQMLIADRHICETDDDGLRTRLVDARSALTSALRSLDVDPHQPFHVNESRPRDLEPSLEQSLDRGLIPSL